eukprot:1491207-Ditylum_brightwellii.AAC.1
MFKYHNSSTEFKKEEGWQFAPMHIIFIIKYDLWYKACFVVGRYVIDLYMHKTYSSTVQDMSIWFMLLLAVTNKLGIMTGNIGNAFCNVPCTEKIWTVAGDDFGEKRGSMVALNGAFYGLKTAALNHFEWTKTYGLEDPTNMRDMISLPLMLTMSIIMAANPLKYMDKIQHHFLVRDMTDSPDYYLENILTQQGDKIHISTKKYMKEVLRKYQDKY